MRREPKVQPWFASLGSEWLMAASPENVCSSSCCSSSQQHQPAASAAAMELLFAPSRSLPAPSLCTMMNHITLYPSATSHPHPFATADHLRA